MVEKPKKTLLFSDRLAAFGNGLMIVSLVGPPGSGKDKKGELICGILNSGPADRKVKTAMLVVSQEIAFHREHQTDLGIEFEKAITTHGVSGLMPDEPVIEMVEEKILSLAHEGYEKIIVNCAPRSPEQVPAFVEIPTSHIMLWFDVTAEESRARIRRRREEAIRKAGSLKKALAKGLVRVDDLEANIERRLKEYNEKSLPAIRDFKGQVHNSRVCRIPAGEDVPVQLQIAWSLEALLLESGKLKHFATCLQNPAHPVMMEIAKMHSASQPARREREERPICPVRYWNQTFSRVPRGVATSGAEAVPARIHS